MKSKKAEWATVFGQCGPTKKSGLYIIRGGKLVPVTDMLDVRQADSVNIPSQAMGCHPDEVPKFQRFYEQHGVNVKHDPTGIPHFDTRADKMRAMAARGLIDRDEVRSR